MVRINLISPKKLADQHLIAEYNEILKFFGYVRKHPHIKYMPETYVLGKGHISFFKNKLVYLKKRHEILKKEMRKRGFKPKKTISLSKFPKELKNDWKPKKTDMETIKKRLTQKLNLKPNYYSYYRKKLSNEDLINKLK